MSLVASETQPVSKAATLFKTGNWLKTAPNFKPLNKPSELEQLVTEDDEPVDNIFSEKQQRLLTDSLYSSWKRRTFLTMANVGLFYAPNKNPLVPDVLVSFST